MMTEKLTNRERQIYIAGVQFGFAEQDRGNTVAQAIENAKKGLECLNMLIDAAE